MANHLKQNQREAYKAARDGGLDDQAAKIVTACFSGESLREPWDRHYDVKHYSQGIAQWSEDRAERIKAHFGKYPKDMTVTEQVKAFLWECERHYKKTWRALHEIKITPEEQMLVMVHDFERPRNPQNEVKKRMVHYASIAHLGADDGTKPA